MLNLLRRIGQTIRIGDDIYVKVTDIEKDRVSIGISAPREIPIVRTEILDRERESEGNK